MSKFSFSHIASKLFDLNGLPSTEINWKLVEVFKESAHSFSFVYWAADLEHGFTSVEVDLRQGRIKKRHR